MSPAVSCVLCGVGGAWKGFSPPIKCRPLFLFVLRLRSWCVRIVCFFVRVVGASGTIIDRVKNIVSRTAPCVYLPVGSCVGGATLRPPTCARDGTVRYSSSSSTTTKYHINSCLLVTTNERKQLS